MIFIGPDQPAVLVLEPDEPSVAGKSRILPILIGSHEAMLIGTAIEGAKLPRPLTHDLFLDAITNLDARVDHAVIYNVKGSTFYAHLYLRQGGRIIELEARPTDAIALAIREGAPFYVAEDVLSSMSFPYIFKEPANRERVLEQFDSFIQNLNPEDLL